MSSLAQKRCLRHLERQAVARCPECGHFYCRECISEHDGRILCAGCLRKQIEPEPASPAPRKGGAALRAAKRLIGRGVLLALAIIVGWCFFYLYGKVFLTIPTSFHNGTVWKDFKEALQ